MVKKVKKCQKSQKSQKRSKKVKQGKKRSKKVKKVKKGNKRARKRVGSSHFLFKAVIARAWSSGRVWSFFLCVCLSKTGRPEYGRQSKCRLDGSKSFVVGVPSWRVGPRHSANVQFVLFQIVEQVVSQGATFPNSQFLPATRRTPEDVIAILAVGESDPTFPALQEALKQAQQAQVQPVESRIKSSEFLSSGRRSAWRKHTRRWRTRRPRLSPQN